MFKNLFASSVMIGLISSTAFAADLPSRRAPPVYVTPVTPPIFTWTGFYIGGQVGYDFGRSHTHAYAPGLGDLGGGGASANGIIGGAHVGYNYAFPSVPGLGTFGGAQFVAGLEGDVDGSHASSSYGVAGINVSTSRNVQGSVRGRLGFAVDRALFYATGGAAFGGLSNTYANAFNGSTDSFSHTRVGYTVGGGVEYAITNNWSLRAEYRRTDFGKMTDVLTNSAGGGVNANTHAVDNRVQGGFSYKFDMFSPLTAPVVARY